MKANFTHSQGSVLAMTMLLTGTLSICVAAYFQSLVPKYRSVCQGASWQEALHGAEAGADYTIQQMNSWASAETDPDSYPWTTNNWAYTDSSYTKNGQRTLASSALPNLGGNSSVRVTKIAVDVYTRDTSSSANSSYCPWFRIRSTARADLPGKYTSADSRDGVLRRMKLNARNGAADDPHVTRTVEVVVRPRYRFSRAIVAMNNLTLGSSAPWMVDSFDSRDTAKSNPGTSAGGLYPAGSSGEIQTNGDIASAKQNPANAPYGPLISGNNAVVKGNVSTNGGDNPGTSTHENVSGSTNMDQSRISPDFSDDYPLPIEPLWTSWTYQGNNPSSFVTGTQANPTRYAITGNQGKLVITAPPVGTTGYVEIIVTGNLSTGSGSNAGITVPPNVYATIWVRGDVDFGSGNINSDSGSSKVATHLTVYGTGSTGTVKTGGSAVQILSFYGPAYNATLNGNVETTGAFVVRDFTISGGGNGGFHYDEALGAGGPVNGWDVASNFEDNRADL